MKINMKTIFNTNTNFNKPSGVILFLLSIPLLSLYSYGKIKLITFLNTYYNTTKNNTTNKNMIKKNGIKKNKNLIRKDRIQKNYICKCIAINKIKINNIKSIFIKSYKSYNAAKKYIHRYLNTYLDMDFSYKFTIKVEEINEKSNVVKTHLIQIEKIIVDK